MNKKQEALAVLKPWAICWALFLLVHYIIGLTPYGKTVIGFWGPLALLTAPLIMSLSSVGGTLAYSFMGVQILQLIFALASFTCLITVTCQYLPEKDNTWALWLKGLEAAALLRHFVDGYGNKYRSGRRASGVSISKDINLGGETCR